MGVVLGYIVCKDVLEAGKIAESLVKLKLVACANIVPAVRSTFFWNGALQNVEEAVLFCKTLSKKIPAVEKKVRSLHSYDVPCICFYRAEHVNADYEQWIRASLK